MAARGPRDPPARLTLDLAKVEVLRINAAETATLAELAPVMEGKPDVTRLTEIHLEDLAPRALL